MVSHNVSSPRAFTALPFLEEARNLSKRVPSAGWDMGCAVSRFVAQGSSSSVDAERPAYPSDPVALLQRHVDHDVSVPMLVQLAQTILQEDVRFAGNASPFLAAMRALDMPAWAASAWGRVERGKAADLVERLTDDMVALAQRPVTTFQGVTQRFAHLVGGRAGASGFSLTHDYAVGSLAAKHDRSVKHRYLRAYGANSAMVTCAGRLLLWRSGRSDTVPKLEEALVGACCATLEASQAAGLSAESARGIHRTGRGLEFRSVIVTAMDRSIMKGMFMRLADGLSERAQLEAIHKARTALFGAETGAPCRLVNVQPQGETQALRVAVRMPPVVNVVLSKQSANDKQLRQARRDNRAAGLVFLADLVEVWSKSRQVHPRAVASVLARCVDEDSAKEVLKALPQCRQYADLGQRQRLALDWLLLTFTGRDAYGCKWLRRADPGKEIVFLKHLLDEIDVLPAAQCKSGMDRTSLITGLLAATECQGARQGEPFDPRDTDRRLEDFRESFTQTVNALCQPLLTLVRGVGGTIKWQDSYVPREYYLPRMEPGAPLGITRWAGDGWDVEDSNLTWNASW